MPMNLYGGLTRPKPPGQGAASPAGGVRPAAAPGINATTPPGATPGANNAAMPGVPGAGAGNAVPSIPSPPIPEWSKPGFGQPGGVPANQQATQMLRGVPQAAPPSPAPPPAPRVRTPAPATPPPGSGFAKPADLQMGPPKVAPEGSAADAAVRGGQGEIYQALSAPPATADARAWRPGDGGPPPTPAPAPLPLPPSPGEPPLNGDPNPAPPAPPAPQVPPYDYDTGGQNDLMPNGWWESEAGQAYSQYLDPSSGMITGLPMNQNDLLAMLAAADLGDNPQASEKFINLQNAMDVIRKAAAQGGTAYQTALANQIGNINNLTQWLGNRGWNFDVNAMLAGLTTTPGGEEEVPGADAVMPGEFDIDTGAGTLPTLNPDYPTPDFLRNGDPAIAEARLEYLRDLQRQANLQMSMDIMRGGFDTLNNDPTRQAMYDFLGQGPHMTYSPEDIGKMKAGARATMGNTLKDADRAIREGAGASGVSGGALASIMGKARLGAGQSLAESERNIDIEASRRAAEDYDRYYGQLSSAQGSLVGPMASYYYNLANIPAGFQVGANPLEGVAQYQFQREMMDPGAMNARDWTTVGAGAVGSALGAIF